VISKFKTAKGAKPEKEFAAIIKTNVDYSTKKKVSILFYILCHW